MEKIATLQFVLALLVILTLSCAGPKASGNQKRPPESGKAFIVDDGLKGLEKQP